MWLEILSIAFILQLSALPGEKGQLIISALSTQYNPWAVVAGASAAFAGWTVIEIIVGNALAGALPTSFIDGATVLLLVIFAIWILITPTAVEEPTNPEPTSPDTVFGITVPARFTGVVPAFSLMAVGEVGDKTQLITITLAATYGAHPAIWAGEMLAIIPISIANALLFDRFSDSLNMTYLRYIAASLFLMFALDITLGHTHNISLLPL